MCRMLRLRNACACSPPWHACEPTAACESCTVLGSVQQISSLWLLAENLSAHFLCACSLAYGHVANLGFPHTSLTWEWLPSQTLQSSVPVVPPPEMPQPEQLHPQGEPSSPNGCLLPYPPVLLPPPTTTSPPSPPPPHTHTHTRLLFCATMACGGKRALHACDAPCPAAI